MLLKPQLMDSAGNEHVCNARRDTRCLLIEKFIVVQVTETHVDYPSLSCLGSSQMVLCVVFDSLTENNTHKLGHIN